MMRRSRGDGERAEYPSDDAKSEDIGNALAVFVEGDSVEDGREGGECADRDPAVNDEVDQGAARPALDGELDQHGGPGRRQGAKAP